MPLGIRILTKSEFFLLERERKMAHLYKRKFAHRETWYAHFTVRGKRYRVKLDAQNRAQAKQMAAEIEYEVLAENYKVLQKAKSLTLSELSDRYLEYAKSNKRSWKRDIVSLNNILRMEIDNRKLGDYAVDSIKVIHVQKYQIRRKRELDAKLEAKGIAEEDRNYASVQPGIGMSPSYLQHGDRMGILYKNPVASKVVRFYKEKSVIEYWTTMSFQTVECVLWSNVPDGGHRALNTGMRLGEILGLSGKMSS